MIRPEVKFPRKDIEIFQKKKERERKRKKRKEKEGNRRKKKGKVGKSREKKETNEKCFIDRVLLRFFR